MPFRAFVDGKLRAAWDFDDAEWAELRDRVRLGESKILLPCCVESGYQGKGFQRTSSRGTKHFYHATDPQNPCASKGESIEHMELKYQIMQFCKDLGCIDVDVERSFKDFRADVCCRMLANPEQPLVFEVQLSSITYDELIRRNLLYIANGIHCIWLMKKFPSNISSHSLLNKAHGGNSGEVFPSFRDTKYKIYAEDQIICVLIDPATGEVGYPKDESKTPLLKFVGQAVDGTITSHFSYSLIRRRAALVEFLYDVEHNRHATLLNHRIQKEVNDKIERAKKQIERDVMAEQTDALEYHRRMCYNKTMSEIDSELRKYKSKLKQALLYHEKQKLALKFILKTQYGVPIYGSPTKVHVRVNGSYVKVYDNGNPQEDTPR